MSTMTLGDEVFESESMGLIEVTSLNSPDMGWRHTDAHGHTHQWIAPQQPSTRYELPTLVRIKDGVGYYPDGSPYDITHYECRQCGDHVKPRTRPDDCKRYIPGMQLYRINGEPVSREEFERRAAKYMP